MSLTTTVIVDSKSRVTSTVDYGTFGQSHIDIDGASIIFSTRTLSASENAKVARQIEAQAKAVADFYQAQAEKEEGRIRTLTDA